MAKKGIDLSMYESNTPPKIERTDEFDVEMHERKVESIKNKDVPGFRRIFDGSLDGEKTIKHPTVLYGINNERLEVLKEIVPNLTKTDAINYIINSYFADHGSDIKKALLELQKNKKQLF